MECRIWWEQSKTHRGHASRAKKSNRTRKCEEHKKQRFDKEKNHEKGTAIVLSEVRGGRSLGTAVRRARLIDYLPDRGGVR
jgi:hypothetical protein